MTLKPIALALIVATNAATAAPTLKLFPARIVDNIQQTTQVAIQMETDVQQVLSTLDQQHEMYKGARCEDGAMDAACAGLRTAVASTYQDMLSIMARDLPKMKTVVAETESMMAKRIYSELGKKRSARDLQTLLHSDTTRNSIQAKRRRQASGNRLRMSDKFRQYASLVSTSRSDASLAVLAADFYVDLAETNELIAYTEQEITRAQVIGQVELAMGGFSPEMLNNIGNIKRILFGEADAGSTLPSPIFDSAQQRAEDDWVL